MKSALALTLALVAGAASAVPFVLTTQPSEATTGAPTTNWEGDFPDLTDFHGLRIRNDDALIELGADADVTMVRTDVGRLELAADEYHVHGEVHAKQMFIRGMDIEEMCNCSKPTDVDVKVRTMTGTTTYSATLDATYVEFYIPGHHWTPVYRYTAGSALGDHDEAIYHLPDRPTKIRFSIHGSDAWGLADATVKIGDEDPVTVLCSDRVGENPSKANNKHWVSMDTSSSEGSLPNGLEFDLGTPMCTGFVALESYTGTVTASETTNKVYVEFLLNDTWTDPILYFDGANAGDYSLQEFQLAGPPTSLRFTIGASDAWGYDFLSIDVNGEVHVLSCEGTQSAPTEDTLHWVEGGSNANLDAPHEQIWDVDHNECELTNVTLFIHVGDASYSGTDNMVMIQFFDGRNWTEAFEVTSDCSFGDDLTVDYRIPHRPERIRIIGTGTNAFGMGHLAISVDNSPFKNLLCAPIYGLNPAKGENGYWVDASTASIATFLEFDVLAEDACPVFATVVLESGSLTNSATDDSVFVAFQLNETLFTDPEELFNGASAGSVQARKYTLKDWPIGIELSADGTNAYGFDSLVVGVNNETYTILCDGTQDTASLTSDHWLDGDGGTARAAITFPLVHDDCETTTPLPNN